jgi:2-dehydro-3-deoxygalactonokinase
MSPDVDVMRGEETQLLGAVALGIRDGWVVLPGTHSKWVLLRDGRIDHFSTYMTGELFAMLSKGGTLAASMQDGADSPSAFAAGLAEARLGKPLSNTLFGVRARVVTGAMPAAQARSTVSGLLIGAEFAAAQARCAQLSASARNKTIHLIASRQLATRYDDAASFFGMEATVLDPDQVYLAALARFFK